MEKMQMLMKKINYLIFRSMMIGNTPNEIVNTFQSKDDYVKFMSMVDCILENDSEFLLLRNFIDKTQSVISLSSEKFDVSNEKRSLRNKYIISLNELKCLKDKDDIIDEYLDNETIMRGYLAYTDKLLFNSMQNDFYVVARLQEAMDGNNKLSKIDNRQFLESSSFFINIMPEIYQLFPKCIDLTENEFNRISNEDNKIKRYVKPIKKDLSRLK